MTGKMRLVLVVSILLVSGIFAYAAIDQAAKQVTDPVCGMKIDPATAKYKFDFEGKTWYFCSEGCLNKFKADPCKFCQLEAKEKAEKTKTAVAGGKDMNKAKEMGKDMVGTKPAMAKEGCSGECAMKDVKFEVTNLPNGVMVKVTSDNPEVVKKIQEMHKNGQAGCCRMHGKDAVDPKTGKDAVAGKPAGKCCSK